MNEHAGPGRTRRSRTAAATTAAARTRRKPPADLSAPIDAGRRHVLIAEAAYYRAQARGFGDGDMLEDWLAAEREVDQRLLGHSSPSGQE